MICSYSLINGKDNQNLETFETKPSRIFELGQYFRVDDNNSFRWLSKMFHCFD